VSAERPLHHGADGRFRNPWPDSEPRGFADVLRWTLQRRAQPRAPSPPRGSLPVARPDLSATPDNSSATWIGHSTVLLQVAGRTILTDPMWSERAFPVQWMGPRRIMPPAVALNALPKLDLILVSHSHYDHLDKTSVRALARLQPNAEWVTPLRLGKYLRQFGAPRVTEIDWWETTEVAGVRITGTPARHFSARRAGDRNRTLWSGFAIERARRRVYFAGDTAIHPEFGEIGQRCGPFDLVLMPIGAYDPRWFMHGVHVDPEESVEAYREVVAAQPDAPLPLMLALHWGTFRLTDEPMDEPPRRATAAWAKAALPVDRLWIARFGESRSW